MNFKMILYIMGKIMYLGAGLMLLPVIVALILREFGILIDFLIPITLMVIIATALHYKKPTQTTIYAKEGFMIVALSWIIISFFGAMPFVFSGSIPSFVDAFFETVSGFTTTGASILIDIEGLPSSILFWRSFTHWIGGMGVLVFLLALLPQSDTRSIHLLRAEVPGPTVGKLVSKMALTARILYGIYCALTVLEIIFLLFGGMPLFDSMVNAFATAGTGGFAIKNASIAYYNSAYVDGVIGVFMILFGINFNLFFLLLIRNFKSVFKNEELRTYLLIIAVSVLIITVNILPLYENALGTSFRFAFFQVASIITTTGFATADFNLWPAFSQTILVLLMFVGASAGSTGGGLKVSRVILMVKAAYREVKLLLSPRSISSIKLEGKTVEEKTIGGVNAFFIVYAFILGGSVLLLSIDGLDLTTNFTSVVACLNNIGPGLSDVGPTGNYSGFSDFSKIILAFNMLAGRLEIFPLLILFSPSTWRHK